MTRQIPDSYDPSPDLLGERTILVTGAGAGLGRSAARAFASHGATVVLLGRTVAGLESLYDEIVQAGHPEPAIYPMDLGGAQPDDFSELAARIGAELGQLDGVLHNAARLGVLSPLEHYDLAEWTRVMQVNVHAPYLMTRACLPLLRKSPDASIVFTASGLGRKGRAYWGAYGVSKFAIEGMMQILAEELEANTAIRVNSLNPGPARTKLRAAAFPAEDPRKLPRPEELMRAYLFLIGPDSQGVNGETVDAQRSPRSNG